MILGIFILELSLRVLWPQENIYLFEYKEGNVFNRANFDDYFSFGDRASVSILKAKLNLVKKNEPDLSHLKKVKVQTNSLGFRSGSVVQNSQNIQNGLRIVALGNSFTFGWPETARDSYPEKLKKYLPKDTEVLNCSRIGANLSEEINFYKKYCESFHPQVVILQVSIFDKLQVPDDIYLATLGQDYNIARVYAQQNGQEIFQHIHSENFDHGKIDPDYIKKNIEKFQHIYKPQTIFYEYSHFIRFIENTWLAGAKFLFLPQIFINAFAPKYLEKILLKSAQGSSLSKSLHNSLSNSINLDEQRLIATHLMTRLISFQKYLQEKNIKLGIVFSLSSGRALNLKEKRLDFEFIKEILQQEKVNYLDFSDALADRSQSEIEKLYHLDDHHLNADGYELMAKTIRNSLLTKL